MLPIRFISVAVKTHDVAVLPEQVNIIRLPAKGYSKCNSSIRRIKVNSAAEGGRRW